MGKENACQFKEWIYCDNGKEERMKQAQSILWYKQKSHRKYQMGYKPEVRILNS
jgi:hypothetical protein